MFNRNLLAAAVLALTAGVSFAQAPAAPVPPVVAHQDQRDVHQEHRIQAGVANGSLTHREASHLQRQQTRIARTEQRDAADGKITPREARHVQKMQNHASRDISKLKHNARTVASK